ncbi:MAG TPA: tetratricopeptide repeat protein [Tepidisphaeraceae bacterium]|jgi:Tfp pilus assembly protein PilF|nr:tetratricopeptide repeat protein [Tepidisphaeraceae bacterium]
MNRAPKMILLVLAAFLAGCQSKPRFSADRTFDTDLAKRENDHALRLLDEGKLEEAESHLKRALEADVMYGPAHNNLGLVYYHQSKLYPAAWEFQSAIKLMPYQPEPRNNLGLVFEKAGKISNAAEAYEKARQMEPDNPEYLANLARAKIRRGDRDLETKKLLEELVLKDSRPQWSQWARINLLRMGDPTSRPAPSTRPSP